MSADILSRVVNGEPVPVPMGNGGMRFHGIVMLDRCCVDLIDRYRRLMQSVFHISKTEIARFAVVRSGMRRRKTGLEVQLRRRRLIPHDDQVCGVLRM